MPSIKEKCVCQICICGQHHCGEKVVPSLFSPSPLSSDNLDQLAINNQVQLNQIVSGNSGQHTSATANLKPNVAQCRSILKNTKKNTSVTADQQPLIECDTQQTNCPFAAQSSHTQRQKSKHHFTDHTVFADSDSDSSWVEIDNEEMKNLEQTTDDNAANGTVGQCNLLDSAQCTNDDEAEEDVELATKTTQRKTWQTSPEEVEELTRSLSRMRTDKSGENGYCYERMVVEKEKSKTTTQNKDKNGVRKAPGKGTTANKDQNQANRAIGPHRYSCLPTKVTTTTTIVNNGPHPSQGTNQRESFLPPLTGFSDSDSSFGSISCSAGDCDKVHCICETMKKIHLEEQENYPMRQERVQHSPISYINLDDNWVVAPPTRTKPRDNLRLEGPMEMETTFRSTYDTTAAHMAHRQMTGKSKRSTGTTSTPNSRGNKASAQLYMNTRKGSSSTGPLLLRSAKRKRSIRNRPMTSLKAGGHGYYNTSNRESYKNFIIINGEARMVGEGVKLPKVVAKKTAKTWEEKNRQKFVKQTQSSSTKETKSEEEIQKEKMVMIGGEEIRRIEKKSYITKSDGAEVTDVERKVIRKVKCKPKVEGQTAKPVNKSTENDTKQTEEVAKAELDKGAGLAVEGKNVNWTIETPLYHPPPNARMVDNIKELGLIKSNGVHKDNVEIPCRPHMRRLHETSKDFCTTHQPPTTGAAQRANHAQDQTKDKQTVANTSKVTAASSEQNAQSKPPKISGHAVMAASKKPFIMPQRVQRHKNECSVNVFEGDIDFITTNRYSYGGGSDYRKTRIGSAQRKRTAGRRYLKSSKRRNLFRQSSDSMFTRPEPIENPGQNTPEVRGESEMAKILHQPAGDKDEQKHVCSTYKTEFADRLYCPALDVESTVNVDNYKYIGEASGHKYYLSSKYE